MESAQLGLEVVPGSPSSAAVTKEGPATDLNMEFVEIVRFVPGWLGAKGTFAQDDVGVGSPGSFDGGNTVVLGKIVENRIRRDIDRMVVSTHKSGRSSIVR